MTPNLLHLFDSHLHLTDSRFAEDRAETIARAREAGVAEMVTVGSNAGDAREASRLAKAADGVWATAGLHPHEASAMTPEHLDAIRELAAEPEVVAIGETGLDYHYENSDRDSQRESFRLQLELAEEMGLPVIVHSRSADEDTAELVSRFEGRVIGVLHCFTGGAALLEAGLRAGWYVSFSGIVTFKGTDATPVRRVPVDRLLIETDSPYLAPVPRRGRRNEPSYLIHTCEQVALLRGESVSDIAESTRVNARALYGLDA